MNEADATKLFNEISKSVQEEDSVALNLAMEQNAPKPEEDELAPEEVEQPEVKDEPADTSTPDPDKGEEDSPLADKPADDADETVDVDADEDDELSRIKEQLDKLSKENHNLKSQAGRLPHVHKRLREMDKKLEELTKAKDSPSSQTSKKIEPKLEAALKKISDDDAELASAIKEAIAEALNGVEEESRAKEIDNLKFLRDQEALSYEQVEVDRLLTMHPNAKEVFASKHWSDWMGSQSAGIRNLAESNSADDVSTAFRLYAQDMAKLYPDVVKQAAKPVDDDAATKAAQIESQRARKKETAADVGNPQGSNKKMPEDAQALFDRYTKEIAKEYGN